jgi:hypothetical protein
MISAYYWKMLLEHSRGMDVELEPNTTLNEKYNILPNMSVPSGIMPKLMYLGVGIDGIGENIKTGHHKYIHTGLYNAIPFLCRNLNNDLTTSEASKYRFRVVKTIGGVDYAFYYLKYIESISDSVNTKTITKNINDTAGGVVDRFNTDDPEILSPTPASTTQELDLTKTLYYFTECKIPISLNQEEKDEMINAYHILTGLNTIPNIVEMCLYTGLDTVLENGLTEAYAVRSGVFYPVPYELQSLLSSSGITQRYIDIGGMRMN